MNQLSEDRRSVMKFWRWESTGRWHVSAATLEAISSCDCFEIFFQVQGRAPSRGLFHCYHSLPVERCQMCTRICGNLKLLSSVWSCMKSIVNLWICTILDVISNQNTDSIQVHWWYMSTYWTFDRDLGKRSESLSCVEHKAQRTTWHSSPPIGWGFWGPSFLTYQRSGDLGTAKIAVQIITDHLGVGNGDELYTTTMMHYN